MFSPTLDDGTHHRHSHSALNGPCTSQDAHNHTLSLISKCWCVCYDCMYTQRITFFSSSSSSSFLCRLLLLLFLLVVVSFMFSVFHLHFFCLSIGFMCMLMFGCFGLIVYRSKSFWFIVDSCSGFSVFAMFGRYLQQTRLLFAFFFSVRL